MSTRLALLLAVILGVVAAVAVKSWIEIKNKEMKEKLDPVMILVAKENLKKGDSLKDSMVASAMVDKPLMTPDLIPKTELMMHLNKMVTENVEKGWPIRRAYLEIPRAIRPGGNPVVKDGKRAVTLQVDQVTGVGGLIQPGYYVDLIGTFDIRKDQEGGGAAPAGARSASGAAVSASLSATAGYRETKTVCLLEAVKVIAVDNRTMEMATRGAGSTPYRTITVEVDPWNAMRLINAAGQGRIHCLLRAPGDVKETLGTSDSKKMSWDLLWEVKEAVDYTKVKKEDKTEK
jgi:Flp pilus assembly protein CpaB